MTTPSQVELEKQRRLKIDAWEEKFDACEERIDSKLALLYDLAKERTAPRNRTVEIPVFIGLDLRPWIDWMENRFTMEDFTELQEVESKRDDTELIPEVKLFCAKDFIATDSSIMPRESSKEMDLIPQLQVTISDLEPGRRSCIDSLDVFDDWSYMTVKNDHIQTQPGLECVHGKSNAYQMLDKKLLRKYKQHQWRKMRLSPKSWMFKFKNNSRKGDFFQEKSDEVAHGVHSSQQSFFPGFLPAESHLVESLFVLEELPPVFIEKDLLQSQFGLSLDDLHSCGGFNFVQHHMTLLGWRLEAPASSQELGNPLKNRSAVFALGERIKIIKFSSTNKVVGERGAYEARSCDLDPDLQKLIVTAAQELRLSDDLASFVILSEEGGRITDIDMISDGQKLYLISDTTDQT